MLREKNVIDWLVMDIDLIIWSYCSRAAKKKKKNQNSIVNWFMCFLNLFSTCLSPHWSPGNHRSDVCCWRSQVTTGYFGSVDAGRINEPVTTRAENTLIFFL